MSKLRQALAAKIAQAFFDQFEMLVNVDGEDLEPAQGWYRTAMQADVYRWEGSAQWIAPNTKGIAIMLYGSDTMTEMVRSGVVLTKDRQTSYDVHAKQRK